MLLRLLRERERAMVQRALVATALLKLCMGCSAGVVLSLLLQALEKR